MSKNIGNKQNSYLKGLWSAHAKKYTKQKTSKIRRRDGRGLVGEQLGFRYRKRGRWACY